ncbi:DNA topoisomerase [Pseudomonas asuensis]
MKKILWVAEKKSQITEAILPCLNTQISESSSGYIRAGEHEFIYLNGHAFELAPPDEYLPDNVPTGSSGRKLWRKEDLPIIPTAWQLVPKATKKACLAKLKQCLANCDVIYHVGDPDAEGQTLVDEALEFYRNRKPVKRVLINDYNQSEVQKALANIRDNHEAMFRGWYLWGTARGRYDWLLGMNATRAMTLRGRELGMNRVLPVGSVKSPLTYVVRERDRIIEDFKPQPFFSVTAQFKHRNGVYQATWKPKPDQPGMDSEGRLIDEAIAVDITKRVVSADAAITSFMQEPKKQKPPLPLAMDELQIEGFSRYGYTSQQVLDAAQKLYEAYKVTTYPRSDNRYLSESHHEKAPAVVAAILKLRPDLAYLRDVIDTSRKSSAFDDKKMKTPKGEPTPHHGIVPTAPEVDVNVAAWTEVERNVYDLIVRSYLVQFAAPYEYLHTTVETSAASEVFNATGKVQIAAGWKQIIADTAPDDESSSEEADVNDSQALPSMETGDAVACLSCDKHARKTTPPARFDEKLLLEAMKNLHKYVHDETAKSSKGR